MTWKRNFAIAFALLLLVSLGASAAPAEEEKQIHVQIKKLHLDGDDHHFAWTTDGQGEKTGHLGVALTALTPELKEHFLLPDSSGVMVSKVLEDSAALEAGLEVGDIISAVDGEAVSSPGELASLIRSHEGGDTVVIEAWRDGKVLQLLTTLGESDNALHMAHRIMKWKAHGDGPDSDVVIDLDHDFNFNFSADLDFDFGCEGENCTVLIDCDGEDEDDCECTVNGESAECPDLGKLHSLHR